MECERLVCRKMRSNQSWRKCEEDGVMSLSKCRKQMIIVMRGGCRKAEKKMETGVVKLRQELGEWTYLHRSLLEKAPDLRRLDLQAGAHNSARKNTWKGRDFNRRRPNLLIFLPKKKN